MTMRRSRITLALALFAMSMLFAFWFRNDGDRIAAWIIFSLPPLLLLAFVLRGSGKAAFWSGVFGLFWFSHGVMLAWSRPAERGLALAEIVLALVIVSAASFPGLHARFAKRR